MRSGKCVKIRPTVWRAVSSRVAAWDKVKAEKSPSRKRHVTRQWLEGERAAWRFGPFEGWGMRESQVSVAPYK